MQIGHLDVEISRQRCYLKIADPSVGQEVEVVAKQLGFDAVAINTRKGVVKFLPDYEFQSITLVKRL